MPRWVFRISPTCRSIVWSGLSELIGSWKIMVMSLPRTLRNSRAETLRRSCPLNLISPEGWLAAPGRSCRIDNAVTDLPDPDSPTSPSVSPRRTSKEMCRTASVTVVPCVKRTERSRIERSDSGLGGTGPIGFFIGLFHEGFARIEGVADGLADKDQQRQHDRDNEEAGETQPRRGDVALALRQQLAQRWRANWKPEAEEIEGSQRRDRTVEDEGQERQRCHHGVWQQVLEHDGEIGDAEGAGGIDVFEIAAAQELGAHQPNQMRPREEEKDAEQDPERRHDHRGKDQQQIEHRDRRPDLDEALEQKVDPPTEIALNRPRGD